MVERDSHDALPTPCPRCRNRLRTLAIHGDRFTDSNGRDMTLSADSSDAPAGNDQPSPSRRFQRLVPLDAIPELVRRHEAGESFRQIAEDYGVSGRRVNQLVNAALKRRRAESVRVENLKRGDQPAPIGNTYTLKHGLGSSRTMAPYQALAEEWAAQRWPNLDQTRRHLVADLAADVERVRDWKQNADIMVEVPVERSGRRVKVWDLHPAVDKTDRRADRLWRMIAELDAEQRERNSAHPQATIDAVLAELAEGDEP